MKIPYKNPRGICQLCGKEWALRNVEPRYHRCQKLVKPLSLPLPPSLVTCGFTVRVRVEDLQQHLNGEQIQAVMAGIGQVIAVARGLTQEQ